MSVGKPKEMRWLGMLAGADLWIGLPEGLTSEEQSSRVRMVMDMLLKSQSVADLLYVKHQLTCEPPYITELRRIVREEMDRR